MLIIMHGLVYTWHDAGEYVCNQRHNIMQAQPRMHKLPNSEIDTGRRVPEMIILLAMSATVHPPVAIYYRRMGEVPTL